MGPILMLLSAACFGAMAVFAKLAYRAGVSPDSLLLLRFAVAAVLMGVLLLVRPDLRSSDGPPGRPAGRRSGARRVVLVALGLGAAGYATQSTLFYAALTRIDASLTALVLYTYPVLVTVAAALLGRDQLSPRRIAAVLVATAGTVLVLVGGGVLSFDTLGVGLAFGAAVLYTVYVLVSDTVVTRLSPVLLSTLVITGATVSLGVRAALTGGVNLSFGLTGWLWVGCIAVISTVVAMLAFFAGLAHTGPTAASILSTFEPVVTTALAALTLGEFLTPVQLVGGVLVLCSVVVTQLRPRAPRPAQLSTDPVTVSPELDRVA